MLECTTEQASCNYRWTFERMLSALPGPGTPAFAILIRELHAYGVSPAWISIEAPSSLLEDVNLRVSLLEGQRALLRITYSAFELTIDYLSEGDDKIVPEMLSAVFRVLAALEPDSNVGRERLTLRAHLSLQSAEPDSFLAERIKAPANQERLLPDLLYYRVVPGEDIEAVLMRIGVTRSLLFEKALFVELIAEYSGSPEPGKASERFARDAKIGFELLGLNPKSKGVK